MYSQCPECQTRFRVTADVLRVAQGTVRCGCCGSAFNALSRLTDSLPDIRSSSLHHLAEPTSAAELVRNTHADAPDAASQPSEFHFSAEDIERVFVDTGEWQHQYGAVPHTVAGFDAVGPTQQGSVEGDTEAGSEQASDGATVEVDENRGFEDITLEGERIVIEGLPDFVIDSSGHELVDAELLEAQAEARARLFPEAAPEVVPEVAPGLAPESVPGVATIAADRRPNVDLDSTDRFEVLTHVPGSAYPEIEDEDATGAAAAGQGQREADTTLPSAAVDAAHDAVIAPRDDELPAIVAAAAADNAANVAANVAAKAAAAPAAPTLGDLRQPSARWRSEVSSTHAAGSTRVADILDEDLPSGVAAGGRRAWAWGLGALLLAIALVAQLTHFYRQDLVRDPNIGPALREIYGRLDLPLASHWDLGAYELRQWGATETTPAGGSMTVRASIKNRATHAQPLPLLRLELEDRFGGTVARRDFEPREYLKDPAQASRLLAADAVTEAELELADTSPDAVGYRLDICMRETTGDIRCAQGQGR
jgi:predicted Zn finger-like uncharacterized protein